MKVHILGCGGWIPGKNETSCFLIEHKGHLIMLDMGTGVSNLRMYGEIMDKYDTLSIILTHYHLDHLIGLTYLPPYVKDKKVEIYGPGIPAYGRSTEDYLRTLLQEDFFSRPLSEIAKEVHCYDYAGKGFLIEDVQVGIKEQVHSSPSFQISIDEMLVYATDTPFDKSLFSQNNTWKILLHECWSIDSNRGNAHTSLAQLSDVINREQFGQVILVHHNPEWTDKDEKIILDRIKGAKFRLGYDGMVLEI